MGPMPPSTDAFGGRSGTVAAAVGNMNDDAAIFDPQSSKKEETRDGGGGMGQAIWVGVRVRPPSVNAVSYTHLTLPTILLV